MATAEDAESRLRRNGAAGSAGDDLNPRGSTRGPRRNGRDSSNGKEQPRNKNKKKNSLRKNSRRPSGTRHVTDRKLEARRRKEKIRRRKRKRNRCAVIERAIDRLERQPEVEFRSPLLRRVTCRDVTHFVILFSVVLFLRSAISRYTVGMLDQLRLGYQFSHSDLDLVKGTELVGFVLTLIFVALFGRRSHRPVAVACGVLVLALGAIVWPVPYFVTSTQYQSPGLNLSYGCDVSRVSLSTVGVPGKVYGQLCKAAKSGNSTASGTERCSSCPKDGDWNGRRDGYLYIVGLGGFLMGFGTGLFLTSGTLYIEEASRPTDVPLKYGFLFFMSGLGEFLGACFAWWFSIYPEDLKGGLAPQPWSVRAWWLGMVVFACLLFFVSWPFLLFPKWIVEPTWSIVRRQARLARLAKMLAAAKLDRRRRRDQAKRAKKRPKQTTTTSDVIATGQPRSASSAPAPAPAPAPAAAAAVSNDPEPISSDESDVEENAATAGVVSNAPVSDQPQRSNNNNNGRGVSFGDVIADREERVEATAPATGSGSGGVAVATASTSGGKARTSQDRVSRVLSECFSAVWRLISDPTYLLAVVSFALAAYLPAGYRTVMTRFVRSQFSYSEFSAFFYADGLSYSLANAIGSFGGGFVVWKLQLSMPKQLRLIISVLAVNIIFFFLLFAVGCWRPVPASYQSTAVLSSDLCSGDCDCSGVQLEEVCSPDGARFPSPCSAGCTSLTLRDSSLIYASCRCVSSDQSSAASLSSAEVSADFCTTCSSFGAYWVLLFLAVVAHSMGYVSFVLYFLRIVKEDERQLSLSFAVWIIALGAYVPGTAVFRGIESSSCGAWKNDCFDEPVCWSYDVDKYRFVIHGSNVVFQFVAILGFVLVLFLLGELHPCRKQDAYSFEDLEPGEGRARRAASSSRPPLASTAASTAGIVLTTTTEDAVRETKNNHRRGKGDGASYSSPVFDAQEDFDAFQFVAYGKSTDAATTSKEDEDYPLEVLLGDLETARTRDYDRDADRPSGESSL